MSRRLSNGRTWKSYFKTDKAYWRAARGLYRKRHPEKIREERRARKRNRRRNPEAKRRINRRHNIKNKKRMQIDPVFAAKRRARKREQKRRWRRRCQKALAICKQLGIKL